MLRHVELSLTFDHLPPALDGFTILQVSDLHARNVGTREQALIAIAADVRCDLLALTGDYPWQCGLLNPLCYVLPHSDRGPVGPQISFRGIVYPPRSAAALSVLEQLRTAASPRYGTFAVQGNHDPDDLMTGIAELGITVLSNRAATIPVNDTTLTCYGLRTYGRATADVPVALGSTPAGDFSIGISHYPEFAGPLIAGGVRLVLCGHTHGGQICLPSGRPLATHSRLGGDFAADCVACPSPHGNAYVSTSRGIGTTIMPIRLNCPPEVLTIRLHRTASP